MALYADGRMIRKSVASSKTLPQLSESALNLFLLLIPHYSSHGKMNGDPYFIKGEILPLFERFTPKKIASCLKEIDQKTNVKWFKLEERWYLHALDFKKHQNLNKDRIGEDKLPSWNEKITGVTQELVRSNSGVTPPEVEVEVKDKVEVEVKDKVEVEILPPIFFLWNDMASKSNGVFAQVRSTASRRAKCDKRLTEIPLADWQTIIDKIPTSPFLCGEVKDKEGKSWRATFDWLIENDKNALKVLEGNYDSRTDSGDGAAPIFRKYANISKRRTTVANGQAKQESDGLGKVPEENPAL